MDFLSRGCISRTTDSAKKSNDTLRVCEREREKKEENRAQDGPEFSDFAFAKYLEKFSQATRNISLIGFQFSTTDNAVSRINCDNLNEFDSLFVDKIFK